MTPAEAQLLLDTAQNAPLQNMRHAESVSQAVRAGAAHFEAFFNAKPVVPAGTTPSSEVVEAVRPREMPVVELMPESGEPRLLPARP